MALMVSSIFSTWPCFTPLLLARPKPSISSFPYSFLRPAIQAILVVPISSPTIIGCSLFIDYVVFSCYYSSIPPISTLPHFHIFFITAFGFTTGFFTVWGDGARLFIDVELGWIGTSRFRVSELISAPVLPALFDRLTITGKVEPEAALAVILLSTVV